MLNDEQITQIDEVGTEDNVSSADPGTSEDNVSSADPGTSEDNVSSGTEAVDYVTSEQFNALLSYVRGIDEAVQGMAPATGDDVDSASDALVQALSESASTSGAVVVLSQEQYDGLSELIAGSVVGSLCICAVLSLVAGLLIARAFGGRWLRSG